MQYRLLILANVCLCSCYHESSVVTMFNTKGTGKTNAPVEYISDAGQISNDSTINYKSFMFSIKNISDSAIWLGRTFSVYFVNREGRNGEGEWVKIDEKLCDLKTCRTGEPTIFGNNRRRSCRVNHEFVFSNYFYDESAVFIPSHEVKLPFNVGHLQKAIIAGRLDETVINNQEL